MKKIPQRKVVSTLHVHEDNTHSRCIQAFKCAIPHTIYPLKYFGVGCCLVNASINYHYNKHQYIYCGSKYIWEIK